MSRWTNVEGNMEKMSITSTAFRWTRGARVRLRPPFTFSTMEKGNQRSNEVNKEARYWKVYCRVIPCQARSLRLPRLYFKGWYPGLRSRSRNFSLLVPFGHRHGGKLNVWSFELFCSTLRFLSEEFEEIQVWKLKLLINDTMKWVSKIISIYFEFHGGNRLSISKMKNIGVINVINIVIKYSCVQLKLLSPSR